MTALLFVAGGVLLVVGADVLVRGASRLAAAAGLTPLVIGLTVVAFGTSAPEFGVTVGSAWSGATSVGVGNVVGSNVFNVLFILGLSALIAPLKVEAQLVRFDVPLLVGVSILVVLMSLDGTVGRWDGALLLAGLVTYTVRLLRKTGSSEDPSGGLPAEQRSTGARPSGRQVGVQLAWILAGLALLVLGSRWFVEASVRTAAALGVSELVIGLTIVAAGTSLPEVAASVMASIRGERDIAVGNVIGSNLFNLLGVLGLAGVAAPEGMPISPGVLTFDLPVMVAVAVVTLPIFFSRFEVGRFEGGLLFFYWVAYVTWLVADSTDHPAQDEFGFAMLAFVIPLTVAMLIAGVVRDRRGRRTRTADPGPSGGSA